MKRKIKFCEFEQKFVQLRHRILRSERIYSRIFLELDDYSRAIESTLYFVGQPN